MNMYYFLGSLIALYLIFVGYFIYSHAQKSAVLIAQTIPYEQHPQNPTLHILIVGDSTAAGVGAPQSSQSIAGRIGADFPDADIRNLGVSGAQLADAEKTLQAFASSSENFSKTSAQQYDLVVLQIGANDITHLTSSSHIRSRLDTLLALMTSISDHVIVFTSGDMGATPIFHFPLSTIFSVRTRQVRDIFVHEISAYPTARYVDMVTAGLTDTLNTDIPHYYAPDLFHPSGSGYGIWYKSVQPVVSDMLKK